MSYMEPEALIEEHGPMCKRIARAMERRTTTWHEYDDLLQEAYICLLHANEVYDQDRGIPFVKFASAHVYLRLIDAVRSMGYTHRNTTHSYADNGWDTPHSLENEDFERAGDRRLRDPRAEEAFEELIDQIADEQALVHFVDYWLKTTNHAGNTQLNFMVDLMDGDHKTFQSIADDLGVSGGRVTQIFHSLEPYAAQYGEFLLSEL